MSALDVLNSYSSAASVAQGLGIKPKANAASPSATSSTSSSSAASAASTAASEGITSSDFLTLLVTEMKNQDPTQPTDPNAYIQQLVGVNSLQQLISINQDLSGIGSTTNPTSGTTATGASSVSSVSNS